MNQQHTYIRQSRSWRVLARTYWRGAISNGCSRTGLFSAMVLGNIFAGAGCATVTVTDAQPLNGVVVTETKPAAFAEVITVSYDPSKPYNGQTHTFNYDYFDQ